MFFFVLFFFFGGGTPATVVSMSATRVKMTSLSTPCNFYRSVGISNSSCFLFFYSPFLTFSTQSPLLHPFLFSSFTNSPKLFIFFSTHSLLWKLVFYFYYWWTSFCFHNMFHVWEECFVIVGFEFDGSIFSRLNWLLKIDIKTLNYFVCNILRCSNK